MRQSIGIVRSVAVAAALLLASAGGACAYTFVLVHNFCAKVGCRDGLFPQHSLLLDGAGSLYGATGSGGARGGGLAFQFAPVPGQEHWRERALYNFCTVSGCPAGTGPSTSLIADADGNLYGTTSGNGTLGAGTVFKLTPAAGHATWTLTVLYTFCSAGDGCNDGGTPVSGLTYAGAASGLPYDGTSPLYGTTSLYGRHGGGVVYMLEPQPGSWKETVLYAFCQEGGIGCTDGHEPRARPTLDASGNLIGTTHMGGANNKGTVYKLTPHPGQKSWNRTTLHDFCSAPLCADGLGPETEVFIDATGNIFGTMPTGGATDKGIIYKIDSGSTFSTVYSFCSLSGCTDGANPRNYGGLVMDASGNLFGTTTSGGTHNGGTVFEFGGGVLTTLYRFCDPRVCSGGAVPDSGVILDASGDIFGTTSGSGRYGAGTIFELTP